MCKTLTVNDYSVKLEELSTDKLTKILDIAQDSKKELEKELIETEDYIYNIKWIISKRED